MSGYEEYQLKWMVEHGYSLRDLVNELTAYQESLPKDEIVLVSELYEKWKKDIGFGSEIWACEEEWEFWRC